LPLTESANNGLNLFFDTKVVRIRAVYADEISATQYTKMLPSITTTLHTIDINRHIQLTLKNYKYT